MQLSIPFNSPSAISICFGDSTRAPCFRRRTVAEFREARMQDARAGKGNREEGGRDRSIASFDRSGNSSTTQFAISRMTLPGFLVAILELDTYLPQYGSSRATRLSPVYLKATSRYSSDLFAVSCLTLRNPVETRSLKLLKY